MSEADHRVYYTIKVPGAVAPVDLRRLHNTVAEAWMAYFKRTDVAFHDLRRLVADARVAMQKDNVRPVSIEVREAGVVNGTGIYEG